MSHYAKGQFNSYITRQARTVGRKVIHSTPTQSLPSNLSLLPTALAQLQRLSIYPPLSLVQDLLDLTGGRTVHKSLSQLAKDSNTGIPGLIALRWPAPARIGMVALLLHKLPLTDWEPPCGISPRKVWEALKAGLKGKPIEPKAPPTPISLLQESAKHIDERLLSLLAILGPQAVEAEPALPLRLLSRVQDLPVLNSIQRQLLGVRICFGEHSGRAIGNAPGVERGQVSGVETASRTDWNSLLPSQLAMPKSLFSYRYQRGELLFRTRELAEPPRLRPTVLLLDVTPPVFGPVEALTRMAAYSISCLLQQARIPVVLVTTGEDEERLIELNNSIDLISIWTQRSMEPPNELRSLKLADAVRSNLRNESGLEPMILLLTQPWFGAEAKIPRIQGLRGLFIQYPSCDVIPALGSLCERWESVGARQKEELGQILGYLIG
ncbi:hypothetical protein [Moorena sp. SIO3H5]|uniref:hypothetical protein n=1 Tax=Moorena sp. SIO3H5 TaxID=2607834 RepID=UPI0013BC4F1E|nr:hypothetical protein [Moorena sp. SIO3H5]NEO73944.1 hypothetical protein [Moorena sp. SIO3H5]